MGLVDRLKVLLRHLRRPDVKPADVEQLDQRLDAVERRLEKVMSPNSARRAQRAVRER